jgi:hypothetical protein
MWLRRVVKLAAIGAVVLGAVAAVRTAKARWMDSFTLLNRYLPWYRLPVLPGVVYLAFYRATLRARNLHDTTHTIPAQGASQPDPRSPRLLFCRTSDGSRNDLNDPAMGMAGTRFGRNMPLDQVYPESEADLLSPSPRTISTRLMTREQFVPARTLNLLAAAWIQFQVHDWFNHGESKSGPDDLLVPVADADEWPAHPMRVARTPADPTRRPGASDGPPTYVNPASHWWDASGIYGSHYTTTDKLRSREHGKLTVQKGRLPVDAETGIAITGFSDNWWIGLALLHTLFTLEHNAICDRLRREYSNWTDDELFERARLINAALMAKIHTVEWTPAILANPIMQLGMRANWWGLEGERLHRMLGRLSESEEISGIPGSQVNHHAAPFALTEEFASVYRLHPLIPDELTFRSLETGQVRKTLEFPQVAFRHAESVIDDAVSMTDVYYSLGTSHPGAVQLHNYPRFLQQLKLPDGQMLDVASIDILRDRERGVPRYNHFRQLLQLPPARTFEELTANPRWAKELREVYDGRIDRVDLMAGMYAEQPPPGFGFSDTAFRIFILMASRRLKSDRFFTNDYTPEVYSPAGMEWIADNSMVTVLLRHYPELTSTLRGAKNAFAPWSLVS